MRFALSALAAVALFPAPIAAQPPGKGEPSLVRVRLVTSAGAIVIVVDTVHAPGTSTNFLAYVDDGRLDGTDFYRAARTRTVPGSGFIQGGIGTDLRRSLGPIPLEPTTKTGLHHVAGSVSMAHGPNANSATGNFTIATSPDPNLDARGDWPGYAAFGHVVSGMDTVRRILAAPSAGGVGPMRGQMITHPIRLISARRLDGAARPTGMVKPWLIDTGRARDD